MVDYAISFLPKTRGGSCLVVVGYDFRLAEAIRKESPKQIERNARLETLVHGYMETYQNDTTAWCKLSLGVAYNY